jgi:agmatinase
MPFDPSAAAAPGSGIFGLPFSLDEARVAVLPVPFDATTSYAKGAANGPDAILAASRQVDLFDVETGRPYEQGIAMVDLGRDAERALRRMNREATRLAAPVLAAGGAGASRALAARARRVNALCEKLNAFTRERAADLLRRGKLVALVGGDHATPFGSIDAHAEAHPGMGVLHVDAHADLREAFEGFTWSHASIMYNVATRIPGIARIVQVGIRDLSEDERDFAAASGGRVQTFHDADLARERLGGESWAAQCRRIVERLPREVYVSFDIDGLDPALCPHTGTPVPGGLSFHEATLLLRTVVESGRRIVGADLNEVSPGPDGDEWDANVGARLLYKMIGWMLASQRPKARRPSPPAGRKSGGASGSRRALTASRGRALAASRRGRSRAPSGRGP